MEEDRGSPMEGYSSRETSDVTVGVGVRGVWERSETHVWVLNWSLNIFSRLYSTCFLPHYQSTPQRPTFTEVAFVAGRTATLVARWVVHTRGAILAERYRGTRRLRGWKTQHCEYDAPSSCLTQCCPILRQEGTAWKARESWRAHGWVFQLTRTCVVQVARLLWRRLLSLTQDVRHHHIYALLVRLDTQNFPSRHPRITWRWTLERNTVQHCNRTGIALPCVVQLHAVQLRWLTH